MNIWIFNHHALTPDMGGGTRHYDFARALVKRDHQVTIVASSFHYSKYKELKAYGEAQYLRETIDGVDFIWIKTPPYFGNGIDRIKNMLSYTSNVLKTIPKLSLGKPDVIIGSSVHLFAVYAAYRLARKYDVPFVMEVRDIWPQTLIDMGISRWHPFILLLGVLERYLYKKADKIITTLPYAYEHIGQYVPKEKVVWISNGVEMENVPYQKRETSDRFVIGYTGAIGKANHLEVLIEAAELLREYDDIFFRIVGEGAEKEALEQKVKEKGLSNVHIEDAVPKHKVGAILVQCDLLYLGLRDSPLYRFGMSMNKLFDYMAAGRVIAFASNARNNPVKDAGAGVSVPPDDAYALKDAILEVYGYSPQKRSQIGERARAFVQEHYAVDRLAQELEHLLYEVTEDTDA